MNFSKALESFKLDTLLEKHQLHILHMADPQDESGMSNFKIVFARGATIGMIVKDTYYMKPEFFKGGKFNTIFIDNETSMIVNTYKIKEVQPVEMDSEEFGSFIILKELAHQAQTADKEKIVGIYEEASGIKEFISRDEAGTLFAFIEEKYKEAIKSSAVPELELIEKLEKFNQDLVEIQHENNKDAEAKRQMIISECKKIFSVLSDNDRVRSIRLKIEKLEIDARKGSTAINSKGKGETDAQKEKETEYASLLKEGDEAYNRKEWKKAEQFYKMAKEIFPKRSHAPEKLSSIDMVKKRGK